MKEEDGLRQASQEKSSRSEEFVLMEGAALGMLSLRTAPRELGKVLGH